MAAPLAPPWARVYLMSLALKCQDLGTAGCFLGAAGGWEAGALLLSQADLRSSLDLGSFGNRVFKERRGLLWCVRGLARSVWLLELRMDGY